MPREKEYIYSRRFIMAYIGDRIWFDSYDPEIPRSYVYPKIPLRDMFLKHVVTKPEAPYLILNDIVLNYQTCNSFSRRFANALLDMGVKKGDRVAIMAANIPQYVLALQACFKIGAIAVPTNPLYTTHECIHQFGDCGVETVVVMAMFADKVIEAKESGKTNVKNIITIQLASIPVDMAGKDVIDFNELTQKGADTEPDISVVSGDIAMLQYTGGTTGVSKGCCLTNFNILAMSYMIAHQMLVFSNWEEVSCVAVIPLYHIFGFNTSVNVNLYLGGSIVLIPRPDMDLLFDSINKYEPTILTAVPALLIGLLSHPRLADSKIRNLRGVTCGSSPLAVDTFKAFEEKSGAWIIEGYGSSETTNIVATNMKNKRKIGSVGLPWPDTDIRIVDLETGEKDMPAGESGEIIAKGPQVMSEYWENPDETAKVLRDGWFYTGDIGYMDEEGFIYIVDRKKDMIICSGFNVYPNEVDGLLYSHPKVREACTVGIPDEKRGETVKAFIVPHEGAEITEDEIKEFCRESLAPYKVPTHVEFLDELPRSSVGKPMRRILRESEIEKAKKA